jgi:hypothetical protein
MRLDLDNRNIAIIIITGFDWNVGHLKILMGTAGRSPRGGRAETISDVENPGVHRDDGKRSVQIEAVLVLLFHLLSDGFDEIAHDIGNLCEAFRHLSKVRSKRVVVVIYHERNPPSARNSGRPAIAGDKQTVARECARFLRARKGKAITL